MAIPVLACLACATALGGCSATDPGPPAPDDLELPVAFVLERDQAGLADAALTRSDPSNPQYGQWLTAQQISEEFGADTGDAEAVLARLRQAGLDGAIHPTGGLIVGTMSPAEAESLLGTRIVTADADGLQVARPAEPPSVPRALRSSVTAVVGLTLLYPDQPSPVPEPVPPNDVTCAPATGVTAQIAEYYGLGPVIEAGRGGEGTVIGLLQTDQSSARALEVFSECYDVRIPPVETIPVDRSHPLAFGDTAQESTLDIIAASMIAPNLEAIRAYQFNPRTSLVFPLARAVADSLGPEGPHIISTSIGVCEKSLRPAVLELGEWLLASATAAGITVVAASGDLGSSSCAPGDTSEASQYPASSQFVTGVGGTEPVRDGDRIIDQVVWNTSPGVPNAGGGATTSQIERPGYQDSIGIPGGRIVPDVAFLAAPETFGPIPVCDVAGQCALQVVGGTSMTAPGLGAAISEVMDALVTYDDEPRQLGLLNPAIYQLADGPSGTRIFMDVTSGDNDVFGVGCCTAVPGYDAASGWGSVNFTALLDTLTR